MTTPFDVLTEDFLRELATIEQLIESAFDVDTATSQGVKVAASNASMLLLAASFEEYARECLKEFAVQAIFSFEAGSPLPPALKAAVWERSLYFLKGAKFGEQNFDDAAAISRISALKEFCLEGQPSEAVPGWISYNQNNLTVKEFNAMFKRVGITEMSKKVGRSAGMVDFLQAEDEEQANSEMNLIWTDFYRERNEVAHSLGSFRTTGVNDILRYISFFRAAAVEMADQSNMVWGLAG